MAILRIKTRDGNIIDIPALQGEDGRSYILTTLEQQEIEDKTLDLMQ